MAATTLLPSYVCTATWRKLAAIVVSHPSVALRMTRWLAEQVVRTEAWRARIAAAPAPARLAQLLVELADEFGEPVAGGRRIPFRLERADLARMVGVARETASRAMAEFERADRVGRDEGHLRVRDRKALLTLAGHPQTTGVPGGEDVARTG